MHARSLPPAYLPEKQAMALLLCSRLEEKEKGKTRPVWQAGQWLMCVCLAAPLSLRELLY